MEIKAGFWEKTCRKGLRSFWPRVSVTRDQAGRWCRGPSILSAEIAVRL